MENPPLELASAAVQDIMEVAPTGDVKKRINILDTKLAIRPFKISMCPDGLEAFVQACH